MSDTSIPAQILHVDDDEETRDQAREYLEKSEIPGWGRPSVRSIGVFAGALSELETRRFDLMILDVRLGGHEPEDAPPDEEEGVRTLAEIRARRFVPVVFWTGLPSKVEHLADPVVRVVDKGTERPLEALLDAVRESFSTRLPLVNRALRHLIEEEQRQYMWDFVVDHWEELRADGDHLAVAYLLARRLGSSLSGPGIRRLAAELGDHDADGPAEGKIHPVEMYIAPPIKGSGPGVADLFRERTEDDGEQWWLLVTPSCDLAQRKAEGVILAPCRPLRDHPDVRSLEANPGSNGRRDKVTQLLKQSTDGQRDRYFFLPKAPAVPDLVADLQWLRSVSREELDAMERVASLVSPFAEAVMSRFVRYFGRVGTADLDAPALLDRLVDSFAGAGEGAAAGDEHGK